MHISRIHLLVEPLPELFPCHVECLRVSIIDQTFSAERAWFLGAPQRHDALVACVLHMLNTQWSQITASDFFQADHTLCGGLHRTQAQLVLPRFLKHTLTVECALLYVSWTIRLQRRQVHSAAPFTQTTALA